MIIRITTVPAHPSQEHLRPELILQLELHETGADPATHLVVAKEGRVDHPSLQAAPEQQAHAGATCLRWCRSREPSVGGRQSLCMAQARAATAAAPHTPCARWSPSCGP